ncbi:Tetratricopeptide TPR_2 repeat protein [Minicystis rosea]|nr:Tetratricopeptide TPR_2 repeat protein [Minicystis rosea]
MTRNILRSALVLMALGGAAASCTLVFGDFKVGETTGTGGHDAGTGTGGTGGCTADSDCPAGDCVLATCDKGVCKSFNLPDGTAVPEPSQVPHDCQKLLCDGTGTAKPVADDTDLPDDGEACTTDTCNSGAAVHTPVALDTDCTAQGPDPKKFCSDPAGTVPGTCVECNTNAQCASLVCQDNKCLSAACGDTVKNGDETDVDCGGSCGTCDNSKQCKTATDCKSGYCQGTTCQPCYTSSWCAQGQYCDTPGSSGVCKPDKATGQSCTSYDQCSSNYCTNGFCCASSSCGRCKSCGIAGSEGTCANLPKGESDLSGNCSSNQVCDGNGQCISKNGQGCSNGTQCASGFCADGRCCDTACTDTCYTCNANGNPGVCSPIPAGQTDSSATTPCNNACDGAGHCTGQPCTTAAQCGTGFCVDGVCCNNACNGTCQSCNVPGHLGSCFFVPVGNYDPNGMISCTGASGLACNGLGMCLKDSGEPCTDGSQCAKGVCQFNACQ